MECQKNADSLNVHILLQDEDNADGASGEDGEGEVDLEEEPDQDKLWEEVDKGLTALQGESVCFIITLWQSN